MQLTDNFTLEGLCYSDTALRRGLDNTPNSGNIHYLQRLSEELLEPAWALLGPFHINSGFRSPAVNQAVGGAQNSAHMDGRAADIAPLHMSLTEAFDACRALPFDQLIIECGAWLHLAIARDGETPRHQTLKATGGPGAWHYEPA